MVEVFYKVKEAYPLPEMRLSVLFANGTTKMYDVKPLLGRFEVFKALEDESLFNSVVVDKDGYGVIWNDDIDLSCNELWENSATAIDAEAFDAFCRILDDPVPEVTLALLAGDEDWA